MFIYTDGDPIKNAQQVLRLYPPCVHAVSLSPVGEILAYEVGTYNNQDEIIDAGPSIVEINDHSKKYIDPNQPSKSVITIGSGTTLSSNILLILAFDVQMANLVKRLYNGPITAGIPATLLKYHPNAYIITTSKVAKEARIRDDQITALSPQEAANWVISY